MIYNSSEWNILLSGDVELNSGPATEESTSAVKDISFSDPNFVLENRIIRYRLTPLDVGAGGDCRYHVSYGVIQVIIWNSQLQEWGISPNGCWNSWHSVASNGSFFGVFRYFSCFEAITLNFLDWYVLFCSIVLTWFSHRTTFMYCMPSGQEHRFRTYKHSFKMADNKNLSILFSPSFLATVFFLREGVGLCIHSPNFTYPTHSPLWKKKCHPQH